MKLLKRIGVALLVLVSALVLIILYMMGSEDVPETTAYEIDLPELRALAASLPGEAPSELRVEIIASGQLPRGLIMAWQGFEPVAMPRPVFQLRYDDGAFLLIDAAYDRTLHEIGFEDQPFDDDAWERLVLALETASRTVITHEHTDHIGGVARHPRPERLAKNLLLNPEQISSEGAIFADLPKDLVEVLEPIRYTNAIAVAPGVVLKRAAGHTPGSQMVFVTMRDGRELLFLGDVVWNLDAITQLKYRPRFITDVFLGEDRAAVLDQIRALRTLYDSGDVELVVSHDARTYAGPGFEEGFVLVTE